MDARRGEKRRAVKRFWLGVPGSFRWWLVGSVALVALSIGAYALTGWVVLIFAAVLFSFGMLMYRSAYVGDEDEFGAEANEFIRNAVLHPERLRESDEVLAHSSDGAEWDPVPADFEVPLRPRGFEDVPVAPVAEDDEMGPAGLT